MLINIDLKNIYIYSLWVALSHTKHFLIYFSAVCNLIQRIQGLETENAALRRTISELQNTQIQQHTPTAHNDNNYDLIPEKLPEKYLKYLCGFHTIVTCSYVIF